MDHLDDEPRSDYMPLILAGVGFWLLLALVIVALAQTHFIPGSRSEPCPLNVQCLIDINGTLVEESK